MTNSGDVIFITGGSSGIGKALAEEYFKRGNKVIVCGRNETELVKVTSANPGMEFVVLDVSNFDAVNAAAEELLAKHPNLNVVVNNAGIQRLLSFQDGILPQAKLDEEIDINLKGLIYVTNAFLPHLRNQRTAKIVQVSSGLALVPLHIAPIYSATKAAVHSFTQSLRAQLKETKIQVVEILPPAVETNLHAGQVGRKKVSRRLGIEDFTKETMKKLDAGDEEIFVGLVKILRVGVRLVPRKFFDKIINKN